MGETYCGDCLLCKDVVDGVGLCKKKLPETHIVANSANRTIVRENGWTKVNITDTSCDYFESSV